MVGTGFINLGETTGAPEFIIPASEEKTEGGNNAGVIVGAVIAGVAGIAGSWFFYKWRRDGGSCGDIRGVTFGRGGGGNR